MSKLSIRNFKKVCDSMSFHSFIFASENQSWRTIDNPMKLDLSFKIMLISCDTNAICFKSLMIIFV